MALLILMLVLTLLSNVPRNEASPTTNLTGEYLESRFDQIEEDQSLLINHLTELVYSRSLDQRNQERLENQLNLLLDYIVQMKNASKEDAELFDNRLDQLTSETADRDELFSGEINTLDVEMSELSSEMLRQNHTLVHGIKTLMDKLMEIETKMQSNFATVQDLQDHVDQTIITHETEIKEKLQSNHDAISKKLQSNHDTISEKLDHHDKNLNRFFIDNFRQAGNCSIGLDQPMTSKIFEANGKCFYLEEKELSYVDAIFNCKQKLGPIAKLAEPTNREETNIISQNILQSSCERWIWIGINDQRKEGQFIYESSGSPVTFTNWEPGEPNGSSSSTEDYVVLDKTDGEWWDREQSYTYCSLCQY